MGSQVQHESQNKENQDQNNNQNQNQDGSTNKPDLSRITELQQGIINESAARIKKLEEALAEKNAPPPPPPIGADDFFKDPEKHIGDIVERRLKNSVSLLEADLKTTRAEKEYQRLLALVRQDPAGVGPKILPIVQDKLDALVQDLIQKGGVPDGGYIQNAIKLLWADEVMNDPSKADVLRGGNNNRNNNNNNNNDRRQIPPNITGNEGRPMNDQRDVKDVEQEAGNKLSELERRLAIEYYGRNNNPFSRYLASRDSGANDNSRGTGSMEILESERGRKK